MKRLQLKAPKSGLLPLKGVIENYLRYYAYDNSNTARAKKNDLQHFYEFVTSNDTRIIFVDEIGLSALKGFIDARLKVEEPSTVARRVATLKHFFKKLAERLDDFINPASELKTPSVAQPHINALSSADLERIREYANEVGRNGLLQLRNKAIIELLLWTGLRVSEVTSLIMSQLSGEWLIRVRCKGTRFRDVYIPHGALEALNEHLYARNLWMDMTDKYHRALKEDYPIFISNWYGKIGEPNTWRMNSKTIYRLVRECGDLAGIKGLHPHLFRHTFAQSLYDSSLDVELVREALGHTSVTTTMRYTRRTKDKIKSEVSKLYNSQLG